MYLNGHEQVIILTFISTLTIIISSISDFYSAYFHCVKFHNTNKNVSTYFASLMSWHSAFKLWATK